MEVHNKFCCIELTKIGVQTPELTILEDINLHIHCRELTVIIGKNGARQVDTFKSDIGRRKTFGEY